MIGKLAIAVVVAAVLAGTLCGCWSGSINAKAPDVITVGSGGDASGQIREFLKEARDDEIISNTQYRVLIRRVKDDDD